MNDQKPGRSDRLYIGIELAKEEWKLGLSDGDKKKVKSIDAGDYQQFAEVLEWASNYFHLRKDFDVLSCYEAGQDGFAPHRNLAERGINNMVVDPGSVEETKKKEAKTDRLDARKLVRKLIHYLAGDKEVFNSVRVPDPKDEDDRELARELEQLKKERDQHKNRIRSLLFKHGIDREPTAVLVEELDDLETSYGDPLGPHLKDRIRREYERLQIILEQLNQVVKQRREKVRDGKNSDPKMNWIYKLMKFKGIGIGSSYILVTEAFGWREFQTRGEIGGFWGFAPTPYDTGESEREQGIGGGPPQLRKMAIEVAWNWLEHQPRSELTQWFYDRWDGESKRMKKVLIVGLARKLMIRLWKYLEENIPPNGSKVGPEYVYWS